jgi:hypothetical protein
MIGKEKILLYCLYFSILLQSLFLTFLMKRRREAEVNRMTERGKQKPERRPLIGCGSANRN